MVILIDQPIEVPVDTIVAAVEIMFDGDRTHATFTSLLRDSPPQVAPGAEEELAVAVQIAGAGAAELPANILIIRAIFNEHQVTRSFI